MEKNQNMQTPLIDRRFDGDDDKSFGVKGNNEDNESVKRKIVCEGKKQLWLAWPLMATNLLIFLLQVLSLMFIGHLDQLSLAGASMAFSFAGFTGISVTLGMSTALDTLCGQSFGAKQYRMMGVHLQRAMLVSTLVCIPISIIWVFSGQILTALAQDPEISTETGKFMIWFIPTVFAFGLRYCLIRFLQTQGIVIPMMIAAAVTAVIHVLASWILINVVSLGNKGAVLAHDISHWTNVILLAAYIKLSPACSKTWTGFSRDAFSDLVNFVKLAIPSTVMVCLVYWSFELLVLLSGFLPNPELETSGMAICLSISQLLFMIPYGLGSAASTRVANELGAGHPLAARLAVWVGMGMALIEGLVFALPLILLPRALGYAFSNDIQVVNYVARLLPIIALANILDAMQYTLSAIARGCGWQNICAILNLGAYYVIGVPCSVVFAFVLHLNGAGLWLGLISGLFVQMLLMLVMVICTNWEKEAVKAKDTVQSALAAIQGYEQ